MDEKAKDDLMKGMSKAGRLGLKVIIKTANFIDKLGQKQYDRMLAKEQEPPKEQKIK